MEKVLENYGELPPNTRVIHREHIGIDEGLGWEIGAIKQGNIADNHPRYFRVYKIPRDLSGKPTFYDVEAVHDTHAQEIDRHLLRHLIEDIAIQCRKDYFINLTSLEV